MPWHDARGNLLTGDGSGGRYGYGLDNRLRSVTGTATLTLRDDAVGRLRDLGGTSGASTLLHAGDQLVAEYARGAAAGATPLRRYVPGAGLDTPVATVDGATGTRLWHHADERGSTVALSDGQGNAAQTFAWDPYGQSDRGLPTATRFGYAGALALPEAGAANLHSMRARVYASRLGRFLQTDPVGQNAGPNIYGYVGGDPVNWVDPLGLQPGAGAQQVDAIDVITVTGNPLPRYATPVAGSLGTIPGVTFASAADNPRGAQESDADGDEEEEIVVTARRRRSGESRIECAARVAHVSGVVGRVIAGAAGYAAGAQLLPYSRTGLGGGGRGTSLISLVARGVLQGSAPLGNGVLGTASFGGAVGRVLSRASVVTGAGIEIYSAYQAYRAYQGCR